MFIIQKLTQDYREKIESWERARDKWLNEDNEYGYRSKRDYCMQHPKPYATFFGVMKVLSVVLPVILIFSSLIIVLVKHHHPQSTVSHPTNCQDFNIKDHVRVQRGDYQDLTGTIIGGCKSTENYQVKLDPAQKANVAYDGDAGTVDVGGKIIGVDASDNLVVIK